MITNSVSPIRPFTPPEVTQVSKPQSTGFQSMLEGMINHVEKSQSQAKQSAENFLTGGSEELHSVALASQRAELEFDMFLQVRNKVVSAYQEVMRMQV